MYSRVYKRSGCLQKEVPRKIAESPGLYLVTRIEKAGHSRQAKERVLVRANVVLIEPGG